jgi:hypothetical protein
MTFKTGCVAGLDASFEQAANALAAFVNRPASCSFNSAMGAV